MPIDGRDAQILAILQQDGRVPNTELADRVALSASPCLRRVKALEDAGVIDGYAARLDRRSLGLGLTVFMEIKVDKHNFENAKGLQEALVSMPECVACHMVSGMSDFLAEIVVPGIEDYERLVTERVLTLPMVKDVKSNFAMRTLKTNGALPLGYLSSPA
ncbi:MAG: Lrp/AsnC family transcriptional regulator [Flavobacteriaceae bacterium]